MTSFEILITVNELRDGLQNSDWRVVDCRFNLLQPTKGYEEYLAGHIPGARYAHLDNDLASPVTDVSGRHPLPAPQVLAETLGAWGISNDSQVIVYDDASGAIAARLWWLMKWLGHKRVAILDGGYKRWSAAHSVTTEIPSVQRATFVAAPQPNLWISTQEVAKQVAADRDFCLIDARDAARFAGETEPIDTVAGHVPGAFNFPFSENLDSELGWLSAGELARKWSQVPGVDGVDRWSVMCGSGVTACHLVASAMLAGLTPPRLYAGSWSEWIRDPSRPIATGSDASRRTGGSPSAADSG